MGNVLEKKKRLWRNEEILKAYEIFSAWSRIIQLILVGLAWIIKQCHKLAELMKPFF